MSAALIPLGQALNKNLLLSPVAQSYYNAFSLGRWPWLCKKNKKLWVDLAEFKAWCKETGRQLGERQIERLDAAIAKEAAKN